MSLGAIEKINSKLSINNSFYCSSKVKYTENTIFRQDFSLFDFRYSRYYNSVKFMGGRRKEDDQQTLEAQFLTSTRGFIIAIRDAKYATQDNEPDARSLRENAVEQYEALFNDPFFRSEYRNVNIYALTRLVGNPFDLTAVSDLGFRLSQWVLGRPLSEEEIGLRTRLVRSGITDFETMFFSDMAHKTGVVLDSRHWHINRSEAVIRQSLKAASAPSL